MDNEMALWFQDLIRECYRSRDYDQGMRFDEEDDQMARKVNNFLLENGQKES